MSSNHYECEVCKKVFARNVSLSEHLNIHKNSWPYDCVTCGQTFRQMSSLKRHQLIHSKHTIEMEKFTCEICSRQFDRKCYLKSHQLSHDTIKTRLCHICGHTFKYQCDLTRHLKIHDNYKHYKCDICQNEFNDRSSLKRHRNRVHKQLQAMQVTSNANANANIASMIDMNISKHLESDDVECNSLNDSHYLNWCVDYISVCRILPQPLPSHIFVKLVDLQKEIALHLGANDLRSQFFNILKTAIQDLNTIIYEHLQSKNKI